MARTTISGELGSNGTRHGTNNNGLQTNRNKVLRSHKAPRRGYATEDVTVDIAEPGSHCPRCGREVSSFSESEQDDEQEPGCPSKKRRRSGPGTRTSQRDLPYENAKGWETHDITQRIEPGLTPSLPVKVKNPAAKVSDDLDEERCSGQQSTSSEESTSQCVDGAPRYYSIEKKAWCKKEDDTFRRTILYLPEEDQAIIHLRDGTLEAYRHASWIFKYQSKSTWTVVTERFNERFANKIIAGSAAPRPRRTLFGIAGRYRVLITDVLPTRMETIYAVPSGVIREYLSKRFQFPQGLPKTGAVDRMEGMHCLSEPRHQKTVKDLLMGFIVEKVAGIDQKLFKDLTQHFGDPETESFVSKLQRERGLDMMEAWKHSHCYSIVRMFLENNDISGSDDKNEAELQVDPDQVRIPTLSKISEQID